MIQLTNANRQKCLFTCVLTSNNLIGSAGGVDSNIFKCVKNCAITCDVYDNRILHDAMNFSFLFVSHFPCARFQSLVLHMSLSYMLLCLHVSYSQKLWV